jgi:hypothetical protein
MATNERDSASAGDERGISVFNQMRLAALAQNQENLESRNSMKNERIDFQRIDIIKTRLKETRECATGKLDMIRILGLTDPDDDLVREWKDLSSTMNKLLKELNDMQNELQQQKTYNATKQNKSLSREIFSQTLKRCLPGTSFEDAIEVETVETVERVEMISASGTNQSSASLSSISGEYNNYDECDVQTS